MKVGIVIPWDTPFTWTRPMVNMLNWERPDGIEFLFINGAGWCPAARHNNGVRRALDWGADYILFNGADHLCPKDIVPRMLKHFESGMDMVHAPVPVRGTNGMVLEPFKAVAFKLVGELPVNWNILNIPEKALKVVTSKDAPQRTDICGTGNLMMKAELFKNLPKPYFTEVLRNDSEYSRFTAMDSQFVAQCTLKHGFKMFCDTTIKIVHLDVIGIDESLTERFLDKTKNADELKDWSLSSDLKHF